jgi:hypothetical protein
VLRRASQSTLRLASEPFRVQNAGSQRGADMRHLGIFIVLSWAALVLSLIVVIAIVMLR